MSTTRTRFWIEMGASGGSGVLAVVTLFWRDWIEVTGWDPDRHSGALEWMVVVALALVSVSMAVMARVEWRREVATS